MSVYLQRTNKPAFVEPASNLFEQHCGAISIANSTRFSTRHTDATRHPLAILVTLCRRGPGVSRLRATDPRALGSNAMQPDRKGP